VSFKTGLGAEYFFPDRNHLGEYRHVVFFFWKNSTHLEEVMPGTIRLVYLLTLLLLLFFPGHILAETATPEVLTEDSVQRLAIAVEDLTRHLVTQAATNGQNQELRKLDIAISYLNFRSRRIELMDRDLSMTKNERDRMKDLADQWQERIEIVRKELEESSGEEKQELDQALIELTLRGKTFDQRLTRLDEDIIIQENRIDELQNELDTVESYVKQHLQL